MKASLSQYERCAPERIAEQKEGITICKQACDRWVDNIYAVVGWIKKRQQGVSEADLAKQFEILVDLDYVNFDEFLKTGGA